MSGPPLSPADLASLHSAVEQALASGDDSALTVLGYGEISLVVGWPATGPRWAAKRVPVLRDEAAADRYEAAVSGYIARLEEGGIRVVPTDLERVALGDGRVCVYCVQPVLDPASLGPTVLGAGGDRAHELVEHVVDRVLDIVGAEVGIDGQVANWALTDGGPRYLDITTPFLRDAAGEPALDTGVFLAALPAPLRPIVHRFVVPDLLERYHDPRGVVLDLAANLHKERLTEWIPVVLERANPGLAPPLTEEEVAADYRRDARLWEALLRVRRADRWWQRRVRRRPYPFLLPGPVQR